MSDDMLELNEEMKRVDSDITKCEKEIEVAASNVLLASGNDKQYWMKKEEALRKKKNSLRKKKNSLRKKEETLRVEKSTLTATEPKADGQQVEISLDAQKTWSALKQANLSSDKFLEFPFEVKEFRELDRVIQSVYLRDSYIDLFDLCMKDISSGLKRIVVTETPGIGKSTFIYYFLWRLLRDQLVNGENGRFNVYIQCSPSRVLQFKGDQVLELLYRDTEVVSSDSKALVFVDMVETCEPIQCPGIRIVVSSPNPIRFKEFSKGVCAIFYMNPWLYDEVLAVWRRSYKEKVSIQDMDTAYGMYGGVIRHVLEKNDKAQVLMDRAFNALYDGVSSLSQFINAKGADEEVTYKILHLSSSDYTMENSKLVLASSYVASRLFKDLQSSERDKAIKFMNNKLGYFQAPAGVIFELLAHLEIASEGISNLRRLFPKDAKTNPATFAFPANSTIGKLNFNPKYPIMFSSLSSNLDYSKREYFQPYAKNFKSIDSFSVVGTNVFAFQITVGKTHTVKGEGLEELVNYVEKVFPSEVSAFQYHLVFISPKGKGATENFTVQPITYGAIGKAQSIPELVKPFAVNQWLVELEILDSISEKFLPQAYGGNSTYRIYVPRTLREMKPNEACEVKGQGNEVQEIWLIS